VRVWTVRRLHEREERKQLGRWDERGRSHEAPSSSSMSLSSASTVSTACCSSLLGAAAGAGPIGMGTQTAPVLVIIRSARCRISDELRCGRCACRMMSVTAFSPTVGPNRWEARPKATKSALLHRSRPCSVKSSFAALIGSSDCRSDPGVAVHRSRASSDI